MVSVGVNPPRTPVHKGSSGIAIATVPNVCKMPGPPAPFVPTPLPNIGKSDDSPGGYTKKVKADKKPVAIKGASFKSMGDMASKGTGGGLVSATTHGATKFVAPGSMNVKFEGKNVQLLGDAMTNNNSNPPNCSTVAIAQAAKTLGIDVQAAEDICEAFCHCQGEYNAGNISGRGCCSTCLEEELDKRGNPNIKSEQSYFMPSNRKAAPVLLTPQQFNQMAANLQGSRLFNFVSGLVGMGAALAGSAPNSSVPALMGTRLSRALRRLPAGHAMRGRVMRPDIVVNNGSSTRALDAKFTWKKGADKMSSAQKRNYPRIDNPKAKRGTKRVVDSKSCGCGTGTNPHPNT